MLTLYEMTGALADLRDLLDAGDLTDDEQAQAEEMAARLLDELIPAKVENYCRFMRSLDLEAAAFKDEERRLTERRQVRERLAERLKRRLFAQLQAAELRKLKAGTFAVSIQASPPSAYIVDEAALPATYLVPQPAQVNKRAVLDALKAGEAVPGALLMQNEHLRIR